MRRAVRSGVVLATMTAAACASPDAPTTVAPASTTASTSVASATTTTVPSVTTTTFGSATTTTAGSALTCTIQARVAFDVPIGWSTNIETDDAVRSCLGFVRSERAGRAPLPRTFRYRTVYGEGFDNALPVITMIAPPVVAPGRPGDPVTPLVERLRSIVAALGAGAAVEWAGGTVSITPDVPGLEWRVLSTSLGADVTVLRVRHRAIGDVVCPGVTLGEPVELLLVGHPDHWFLEVAPNCGVYTDGVTPALVAELLDAIGRTLRPA